MIDDLWNEPWYLIVAASFQCVVLLGKPSRKDMVFYRSLVMFKMFRFPKTFPRELQPNCVHTVISSAALVQIVLIFAMASSQNDTSNRRISKEHIGLPKSRQTSLQCPLPNSTIQQESSIIKGTSGKISGGTVLE